MTCSDKAQWDSSGLFGQRSSLPDICIRHFKMSPPGFSRYEQIHSTTFTPLQPGHSATSPMHGTILDESHGSAPNTRRIYDEIVVTKPPSSKLMSSRPRKRRPSAVVGAEHPLEKTLLLSSHVDRTFPVFPLIQNFVNQLRTNAIR